LDWHNVSLVPVLGTVGLLIAALALSYLVRRTLQESLRRVIAQLRLPYELWGPAGLVLAVPLRRTSC